VPPSVVILEMSPGYGSLPVVFGQEGIALPSIYYMCLSDIKRTLPV